MVESSTPKGPLHNTMGLPPRAPGGFNQDGVTASSQQNFMALRNGNRGTLPPQHPMSAGGGVQSHSSSAGDLQMMRMQQQQRVASAMSQTQQQPFSETQDMGYRSGEPDLMATDYKLKIRKPKGSRSRKRFQLHSRGWNDRFSVTYSKDNDKYHTYFKEFFDKPVKLKTEHITFFPRPQDPEVIKKHKIIEEVREPLKKTQDIHKHLTLIQQWQAYHNVMASKNNKQVHRTFKEFFDRPIKLDPNGYHFSKLSEPMEVYHAQTPVRSVNQSVALFKSHQRAVFDELCKTRPKTFNSIESSESANTLARPQLTQTYGVIPFLREETPMSKTQSSLRGGSPPQSSSKKLEGRWDSKAVGLPISSYNERVHSSFRIGFQDLNHKTYNTITPSSKKSSKFL